MKIREFIEKNFDIIETILLLILLGGIFSYVKEMSFAKYAFPVSVALITILYWFKATLKLPFDNKLYYFYAKINWYGLMLSPLALYSKLKMYDKSDLLLLMIMGLLVAGLVLFVINKAKNKELTKFSDITRTILALVISLILYLLPLTKF